MVAPQRRLDVVLPEHASVAEVLPGVLGKAGEHLADQGVPDGGWVLRHTDGTPLTLGRTLAAHRIRDGQLLHLVSRQTEWPELEYDDLVDAVATGSGRLGAAWGPWHTRLAGLTLAALAVLASLVPVLRLGSPWSEPALWCLALAALLVGLGVVLARAVGDAAAGALSGALALLYAAVGGGLLLAGTSSPRLGAPQLLMASVAVLLAGTASYLGIVDRGALFAGAMSTGLVGVVAGWLGTAESLDAVDVSAIVAGALLAFSPLLAPASIRLGRLPMPILPRSTGDLVRDDPQPPRRQVYAAVVRADGILTGMLSALALACSVPLVYLIRAGTRSAIVYAVLLVLGCLLRARLYPIVRQRLPLLIPGTVGALGLLLSWLPQATRLVPVLVVLGCLLVFVGLRYSTRPPNPYMSRYAELLEIVLVLALVPVACSVLGLYGLARGLGG